MPQQPTTLPDPSSVIANARPPDGISVVAKVLQPDANWSMTASASEIESGGAGCPRRSRAPLYRRIAGSANASTMNRASPFAHGRSVTTPSESVTTGSSESAAGTAPGDGIGPPGSSSTARDQVSGGSLPGSYDTEPSCPSDGRPRRRATSHGRVPRACRIRPPGCTSSRTGGVGREVGVAPRQYGRPGDRRDLRQGTGAPVNLARIVRGSVINAGDGTHEHPTQALLDAFTMRQRLGRIEGLKVTIVGDILHSRVARSNVLLLKTLGADVTLVAPPTLLPDGRRHLAGRGLLRPRRGAPQERRRDDAAGPARADGRGLLPQRPRVLPPLRPRRRPGRAAAGPHDRHAPGPDGPRHGDRLARSPTACAPPSSTRSPTASASGWPSSTCCSVAPSSAIGTGSDE